MLAVALRQALLRLLRQLEAVQRLCMHRLPQRRDQLGGDRERTAVGDATQPQGLQAQAHGAGRQSPTGRLRYGRARGVTPATARRSSRGPRDGAPRIRHSQRRQPHAAAGGAAGRHAAGCGQCGRAPPTLDHRCRGDPAAAAPLLCQATPPFPTHTLHIAYPCRHPVLGRLLSPRLPSPPSHIPSRLVRACPPCRSRSGYTLSIASAGSDPNASSST